MPSCISCRVFGVFNQSDSNYATRMGTTNNFSGVGAFFCSVAMNVTIHLLPTRKEKKNLKLKRGATVEDAIRALGLYPDAWIPVRGSQPISLDEPLKQRVAVRIKLTAYSEGNTQDYIKHRLEVAGSEKDIFTPEAIKLIYKYSKGSPRLINTICDNALLEGILFKESIIDDATIKTVDVDLGIET